MLPKRRIWLMLASTMAFTLALFCVNQANAAQSSSTEDRVVFEDCSIGSAGARLAAQCATLAVPLDPANLSLGTHDLAIARIQSRRRSGNKDAFTLLAGGPGQSAIDSYPAVSFAFRHILRDRDIILIDQRGTGGSTNLQCPEDNDSTHLDGGLNLHVDPQELSEQSAACLDSLPVDARLFTTSVAVHDLENVRKQLGITQWNLYGVSYGTRVAAHYLRRYPDSVRTIILDAVVPPQVSLGPDIARFAQQAMEHIFARCAHDEGCQNAFGNLTEQTLALMADLEENPRTITYEDIATGKLTTREFTRDHLAITLRLMSYSSQTAAILPSMIYEAITNNNLAPLARQADMQGSSVSSTLSTGMHHAVICTEDAPFFTVQPASSNTVSYLGSDTLNAIRATCNPWPPGVLDDDFKTPLTSSKPALILSGGADPITPPEYGEMVLATLSGARHIVNESQGHMQAPFGCTPVLLAQFIESADAKGLDTQCLKRLKPTAFFVDANGPLP